MSFPYVMLDADEFKLPWDSKRTRSRKVYETKFLRERYFPWRRDET